MAMIRLLLCALALMALSRGANAQGSPPPIGLWQGMNSGDFILVQPNGGKTWRFACRFEGKQKLLSGGPFPKPRFWLRGRGAR